MRNDLRTGKTSRLDNWIKKNSENKLGFFSQDLFHIIILYTLKFHI